MYTSFTKFENQFLWIIYDDIEYLIGNVNLLEKNKTYSSYYLFKIKRHFKKYLYFIAKG